MQMHPLILILLPVQFIRQGVIIVKEINYGISSNIFISLYLNILIWLPVQLVRPVT